MPPYKKPEQKRDRYSTNLKRGLAEVVKKLADKERRTFAAQVQTLIEEALAQRSHDREKAAFTVRQHLGQLSLSELAEIVELVGKLQVQKLQECCAKPNNQLALLVAQHKGLCNEAFAHAPDELEKIIKGGKPKEEDLPILAACTNCDLKEIRDLYKREFQNGNGSTYQEQL